MKKFWKVGVVALAIVVMSTCFVACDKKPKKETPATTFVTLDINPSIEFVLDEKGKVLTYHADNEDAAVMLYGEADITGKTIEEATNIVLQLSYDLGFLNKDNTGVNVSVVSSKGADAENNIYNDIEVSVNGKKSSFNLQLSAKRSTDYSLQRETEKLKKDNAGKAGYDTLTAEKLALIKVALAQHDDLTMDVAVTYSVDKLMAMSFGATSEDFNKYKEIETDVFKKAKELGELTYNNMVETIKTGAWTAEYFKIKPLDIANYTNYNLLVATANSLEMAQLTIEQAIAITDNIISKTDTKAIADLLGVPVDKFKDADGKITIDSIDNAIDKEIKNKTADELAAMKDTIAKLDTKLNQMATDLEAKGLPEQFKKMATDLVDILNKTPGLALDITVGEVVQIEDLSKWAKACDDKAATIMTEMKGKLTAEQITAIDNSVTAVENKITAAKKDFDTKVATAKKDMDDALKAAKDKLLAAHKAA
ncbi:MAG: hypothetical protein RSB61_05290 [Clostridia bacterium]